MVKLMTQCFLEISAGFCRQIFREKVEILSKSLPQIPNFANFVKNQHFRHDGQFSSFRQFFVKNEILWSLFIGPRQYSVW